jgi:hypothetical protein
MEQFKCCLCGKLSEGFGNNPDPLPSLNDSDECCDECNGTKVIPARLSALMMMDGLTSRVKRFDSEKEN